LAETLAGNDIAIHDCASGDDTVVAAPSSGNLAAPLFLSNDDQLLFAYDEAVNGAFEGHVGIGLTSRTGKVAQAIVPPRKEGTFWHLIDFVRAGDAVIALDGTPRPGPRDTYLAQEYQHEVWCAWPKTCGRSERTGVGRTLRDSETEVSLAPGVAGGALVFDGGWRGYSTATGRLEPSGFVRPFPTTSRFSPGLDRVAVFAPEDEPTRLDVVATKSGRVLATHRRKGLSPALVEWAPDGKRIAVVFRPSDESSRASDLLVVVSAPGQPLP
jgi:hypothetical protein